MHSTQEHAVGGVSAASGISRRQLLIGAGGLAGAAVVGGAAFEIVNQLGGGITPTLRSFPVRPSGDVRDFHTRPDLKPPTISLTGAKPVDDGLMFLGPWASGGDQPGPLVVDQQAEPVWFKPVDPNPGISSQWGTNFKPWEYRGKAVLAWWEGHVNHNGLGVGEGVVMDSSYREVARIRAANGLDMDLHELRLTPEGTALFTCYPRRLPFDLSPIGGPRDGHILESVIQEVDVRTGRLLMEWRSLDHIPVTDSYHPAKDELDYVHINSIDFAPDGNLLVSGRHTWALYKLDRRTGHVIWTLGGKQSDFDMGKGAQMAWQHDAKQQTPSTISLFDNGSNGPINTKTRSRGIVLKVDESGRKVTLAQEYRHPTPLLAVAMGSVQTLPSGHVLVGWGTEPYVSEFTADGSKVLGDARLLSGYKSYRAFRVPWQGIPQNAPDVSVSRSKLTGKATVYVSWNGATDVAAYWQVHAGSRARDLRTIGVASRRGFETAIPLPASGGHFAVTALDEDGSRMATSRTVSL
ncbi:MAG: arylsulfotransferase family protein [Solirubrobacteraceae bacterium]